MEIKIEEVIKSAKEVIDTYSSSQHKVAAVLATLDGQLFKSVSVQGQKMHLCSEWSALVQALMAKATVHMAVAVYKNQNGQYIIFPPCALCRELYLTYFPNAQIIVSEDKSVIASELLPYAWKA